MVILKKLHNILHKVLTQSGMTVHLMQIDAVDWDALDQSDAIVLGCPTYMGSLTSDLKQFMEQSSKRWLARSWQGKLSAAFTNGGGLSGDKLAVLQQILPCNMVCYGQAYP